jgi:hypothetical protein
MSQFFVLCALPNRKKFFLGNVNGKHFCNLFDIFGSVIFCFLNYGSFESKFANS